MGANQTAVGSTLVVLKGLNVIQLQTERAWEGKLEGVEGLEGLWKSTESLAFIFIFFLK